MSNEYEKIAKYLNRSMDTTFFSPNIMASVLSHWMPPHLQLRFVKTALLLLLVNWDGIKVKYTADEHMLVHMAEQIRRVYSIGDL